MYGKRLSSASSTWFDIMLFLLAAVAGSIDVISYYKLGHVFTANMTGNTILLGLSIGQGEIDSSLHSLAALTGFFTGAFIGAFIVENSKRGWSFYITLSISIECLIIFILVLIWFEEKLPIDRLVLYSSIALSAIAMGIQSATVRHLNIPGVVTTFITGTITSIGMSAIKGIRKGFKERVNDGLPQIRVTKTLEQRITLQFIIFLVYGLSAVLTGWLEFHQATLLPLLPLIMILSILAIVIMRPGTPHISE